MLAEELPKLITAEEIAAELGYCERHVKERLTKQPDFPVAIKIGSRRKWMVSEFNAWLLKQRES